MRLLIVCAGNTCRSPMAGGLARKIAIERAMELEVRTAGVAHHPNSPVEPKAVTAMAEVGVDVSSDYSKPLTAQDIEWADSVVAVEQEHASYLAEEYPAAAAKLHSLASDVQDPYGQPLSEYRKCRDCLEAQLLRVPIWREWSP